MPRFGLETHRKLQARNSDWAQTRRILTSDVKKETEGKQSWKKEKRNSFYVKASSFRNVSSDVFRVNKGETSKYSFATHILTTTNINVAFIVIKQNPSSTKRTDKCNLLLVKLYKGGNLQILYLRMITLKCHFLFSGSHQPYSLINNYWMRSG